MKSEPVWCTLYSNMRLKYTEQCYVCKSSLRPGRWVALLFSDEDDRTAAFCKRCASKEFGKEFV